MKNILIFGRTQKSAIDYMRKIASKRNDMKEAGATWFNTLNENHYRAVAANDSARGCRCSWAYVQNGIDEYAMTRIILPCFVTNDYDIQYFN